MIVLGHIQILCAAQADQAALEEQMEGVFTKELLRVLSAPHNPSLLRLPLNLSAWRDALPEDLRADRSIEILANERDIVPTIRAHERDVLPSDPTQEDTSRHQEPEVS